MNTTLIEAMQQGDTSAITLLEYRLTAEVSYGERHRIAAALLGRADDDSVYVEELLERAAIAVRFPRKDGRFTPEFEALCAERHADPVNLWNTAYDALARSSTRSALTLSSPHRAGHG